ncbi:MAG: NERD domain-containing protein [Chloroflexi bacterium]|nr:NERD domain-containing protein [Chloroflexota bacterium]
MARMIPATLPEETESEAERRLFPVLRDGLNDSFTVFHSFHLLTHNRERKFIEGEIDFLILSGEAGLLVLEVKSGLIRYDGPAGIWYQNQRPLEKSPLEQALAAKYQLRDFLAGKMGHMPSGNLGHAVCFPDVSGEMRRLPSGADPAICLTAPDLGRIASAVSRVMESFEKHAPAGAERNEAERIRQILMPCCEYGVKLSERLKQEGRILFALTENQCRFLDFIHNRKRALVEGCAGSGKTVMAVKKARELANQGATVLVLAYNQLLGKHLENSLKDAPHVNASTYHDFCIGHLRQAGRLPPSHSGDDYWQRDIPEAFAEWLQENPLKYDAVIVDEGQDFRTEYWLTIEEMRQPDGHFYIFYDPAQNIFKTEMEFPIREPPFTLTDNCRNTQSIFEELQRHTPLKMRLAAGAPAGAKVVELSSSTPRNSRRHVGAVLHELLHNQGLKPADVAIIGAHSLSHTCLGTDPRIGSYIISEGPSDKPEAVPYYTYMKFKGCEAAAVILLDVDPHDERWAGAALYTAMSRARHLLYVIRRAP